MSPVDPDERERQAVGILLHWPSTLSGVLVGGYAIAAYAPARYSEDLDLAVTSEGKAEWEGWLSKEGLHRERLHRLPRTQGFAPEVGRWRSRDVFVDLMAGGIRDRETGTVLPEDWVIRNPNRARLELISGRVESIVAVARPEAIWAMKLVAGRPQDLTDLYSMAGLPIDIASVRELLSTVSNPSLTQKFGRIWRTVLDRKQYVDSLSRLRLGSPDSKRNIASWKHFQERISDLLHTTKVATML